jgi:hypothetical protein
MTPSSSDPEWPNVGVPEVEDAEHTKDSEV